MKLPVAPRAHRPQRRPSETQGIISLPEGDSGSNIRTGEIRFQRFAVETLRSGGSSQIKHSGKNVCSTHLRVYQFDLAVGDWARREGLGERDSILGQSIQRGRPDAAVTVAMHVIETSTILRLQTTRAFACEFWGCPGQVYTQIHRILWLRRV